MKTIVVAGGQSNIGKTTLVLALCELLPNAVAVKLGHGPPKDDKPGAFYGVGTSFAVIAGQHPNANWLVIESNRILKEITPDLVIYLPSESPKPSAKLAAEKADIVRGETVEPARLTELARQLGLDEETVSRIGRLAGAQSSC